MSLGHLRISSILLLKFYHNHVVRQGVSMLNPTLNKSLCHNRLLRQYWIIGLSFGVNFKGNIFHYIPTNPPTDDKAVCREYDWKLGLNFKSNLETLHLKCQYVSIP